MSFFKLDYLVILFLCIFFLGDRWFRRCLQRNRKTSGTFKLQKSNGGTALIFQLTKKWKKNPWECESPDQILPVILQWACTEPVLSCTSSLNDRSSVRCRFREFVVLQLGVWGRRRQARSSLQQSAKHPEEDGTVWRELGTQHCIAVQYLGCKTFSVLLICCSFFCALENSLHRHRKPRKSGSSTKVEHRKVQLAHLHFDKSWMYLTLSVVLPQLPSTRTSWAR